MVTEKYKFGVKTLRNSIFLAASFQGLSFSAFPIFQFSISFLLLSENTEFISLLTWKVIFSKLSVWMEHFLRHSFTPLPVRQFRTSADQLTGLSQSLAH